MNKLNSSIIAAMVMIAFTSATAFADGPIRKHLKELVQERRQERLAPQTPQDTGLEYVEIEHDGRVRNFLVHTPPGFYRSKNNTAVLTFHGGGGDGAKIADMSRMSQYADRDNFLAVYPNAGERQWNDGRLTTRDGIDDVGFVRAIVDYLQQNYGVNRVFAAGASNGGMIVQRLACEAPNEFAAYAVLIANMPTALRSTCNPSSPLSMIFFHGTEDPLMPFYGGTVRSGPGAGAGGQVMSVEGSLAFWSAQAKCSGASEDGMPDQYSDGTSVTRIAFIGCVRDLMAYQVEGGGHTWPGSGIENRIVGQVTSEIDASALLVDFFGRRGL